MPSTVDTVSTKTGLFRNTRGNGMESYSFLMTNSRNQRNIYYTEEINLVFYSEFYVPAIDVTADWKTCFSANHIPKGQEMESTHRFLRSDDTGRAVALEMLGLTPNSNHTHVNMHQSVCLTCKQESQSPADERVAHPSC